MKYKKSHIDEIINDNGDLIGDKDIPQNGSNMETQANNTTDYNAKVGHQPYRYDMLGRFGFTLLPFFEGVEDEEKTHNNELYEELVELMHERYLDILGHYYRNPKNLQPDYRKASKGKYTEEAKKYDEEWAEKIINIIKPHLEKAFSDLDKNLKENIDENTFIEGKMLDSKATDNAFAKEKRGDNDVLTKKIKKIAGLINKLDKDEIKKIKNLLETE